MHRWVENLLAVQLIKNEETGLYKPTPIHWFPKCSTCGCLVTEVGKKLMYRPLPNSPWTYEEPECHVQVP